MANNRVRGTIVGSRVGGEDMNLKEKTIRSAEGVEGVH